MFSHSLLIALLILCCSGNSMSGNNPEIIINTLPVSCLNSSDGEISIIIPDVSQTYTAQLYKYSPSGILLTGLTKNDTAIFIASGLNAGKYVIDIKGDKGFSITKSIEIVQPDKLESGKIIIIKKLSGLNASDAVLKAIPGGGVPPYSYSWNIDGVDKNSPEIKNVGQGTYSCIINDANNCGPVKTTILFNQYVIPDIVDE